MKHANKNDFPSNQQNDLLLGNQAYTLVIKILLKDSSVD